MKLKERKTNTELKWASGNNNLYFSKKIIYVTFSNKLTMGTLISEIHDRDQHENIIRNI